MNKKRVAGLILLLPLGLLAACGGGGSNTLAVSPNWYANTTTSLTDYSKEELEYAVTFTPPAVTGKCTVSYETGTYRTTFETFKYEYEDGTSENAYLYTTRLDISGHYTYDGTDGETFNDFVDSKVYFRTAGNALVPISSSKEIFSTSPVQNPHDDAYSITVHIKYDTVYNTASALDETLQSAEITSTVYNENRDTEEETPGTDEDAEEKEVTETTTVKIKRNVSFFDNEEILFAMRGLDLSAVSKFYSIDPRTNAVAAVSTGTPEKATYTPSEEKPLTIDGTAATEEIEAYRMPLFYNSSHSGPERTVTYAAKGDSLNNKYRNVLLQLEDPIPYGYGTLIYTLRSAKFAN